MQFSSKPDVSTVLDDGRLTRFEEAVLEKLLEGAHPVLEALRQQAREAKVRKRSFSGVGFFSELALPANSAPAPTKPRSRLHLGNVSAVVPELKHGAGFVLFVENGYLTVLEGYSYDEPWNGQPSRFELFQDDAGRAAAIRELEAAAECAESESSVVSEVAMTWRKLGIASPPATAAALDDTERRYGARLPSAFRELYLRADGMLPDHFDAEMIRFLSLAELERAASYFGRLDGSKDEESLVFAEWSLSAHGYAIRLDTAGKAGSIDVVWRGRPLPVAPTFAEFLDDYLYRPRRLFPSRPT